MFSRRKSTEASLRAADRREREDAAERLAARVPTLASLEIALEERRSSGAIGESRHVRRFVVERAPALFDFPCSDTSCADGGHEVTREVLAALRSGARAFAGEHACGGSVGATACARVLRYALAATFRA
jgi:hypothetical protein